MPNTGFTSHLLARDEEWQHALEVLVIKALYHGQSYYGYYHELWCGDRIGSPDPLLWSLVIERAEPCTDFDSEFDDISFRLVVRAVCSKCFHACESSREEMPSSSSPELQASLRGVGSPVDTACQCACSFCSCSRIWNIGLG